MTTETPKKSGPPKIVKLNNALKLAEEWVNKMSGSVEDEAVEVEPEGRPIGLGLGAKVPRQSKVETSNEPVGRKLYAKLNAAKRKSLKSQEELSISYGRDMADEDEDDDDDLESRSSAFVKKRPAPQTSQLQAKKKRK